MSDPEKEVNKRGPKHTRIRYYTSYEEATIVKVWREHLHEISSYSENLTIFREIAFGLQQHRIRLNKQEVRRRISSYRNKYLVERGRLNSDPNYISDWRLYPLIDCLLQSDVITPVPKTESKVIDELETKIRSEFPSLPRFTRQDSKAIKYVPDPDSCPFIEGQQPAVQIKSELFPPHSSPVIKTEIKVEVEFNETLENLGEKRSPLTPVNRSLEQQQQQVPSPEFVPAGYLRRSRRRSFMPRTGQLTLAQIELLRQENVLLQVQLDVDLQKLELKEREYRQLEQSFDIWLHQQEQWVKQLDGMNIK